MAPREGFEPPTKRIEAAYSNPLSYRGRQAYFNIKNLKIVDFLEVLWYNEDVPMRASYNGYYVCLPSRK